MLSLPSTTWHLYKGEFATSTGEPRDAIINHSVLEMKDCGKDY